MRSSLSAGADAPSSSTRWRAWSVEIGSTCSTPCTIASPVASFGRSLRDSEYRGTATPEMARRLASGALGRDEWGYRADFVRLVSAYMALPEARVSEDRRK